MSKNLAKSSLAIAVVIVGWTAQAEAGWRIISHNCVRQQRPVTRPTAPPPATQRMIYKPVQPTPQYDFRRPEVVSGARVTLFANFLREESGCVLFNLEGTSTECALIDWKPDSVTLDLPCLGLLEPKYAEIQIVLPDGRVAKTFAVLYVSQPDIVVHEETVPLPMPSGPSTRPAAYAAPVDGAVVLHAGVE
jgi:hypothetical protein